jgi:hypothetical protein
LFDDSVSKPVTEEHAQRQSPYLLFYTATTMTASATATTTTTTTATATTTTTTTTVAVAPSRAAPTPTTTTRDEAHDNDDNADDDDDDNDDDFHDDNSNDDDDDAAKLLATMQATTTATATATTATNTTTTKRRRRRRRRSVVAPRVVDVHPLLNEIVSRSDEFALRDCSITKTESYGVGATPAMLTIVRHAGRRRFSIVVQPSLSFTINAGTSRVACDRLFDTSNVDRSCGCDERPLQVA